MIFMETYDKSHPYTLHKLTAVHELLYYIG